MKSVLIYVTDGFAEQTWYLPAVTDTDHDMVFDDTTSPSTVIGHVLSFAAVPSPDYDHAMVVVAGHYSLEEMDLAARYGVLPAGATDGH